jgi:hypothetical protein
MIEVWEVFEHRTIATRTTKRTTRTTKRTTRTTKRTIKRRTKTRTTRNQFPCSHHALTCF